ncbi:hypothetical protein FB451DRAFT_1148658 [Mycena latifolia]|nr:hypothetical protein FB451DRAFT_1148658 [Mycena latifolia]
MHVGELKYLPTVNISTKFIQDGAPHQPETYNKSVDWCTVGILIYKYTSGPYHTARPSRIISFCTTTSRWPIQARVPSRGILPPNTGRHHEAHGGGPSKRFGNMWCGAADIFEHPWFR